MRCVQSLLVSKHLQQASAVVIKLVINNGYILLVSVCITLFQIQASRSSTFFHYLPCAAFVTCK